MHIFHVVFRSTWRDFTKLRHFTGQAIDVGDIEVDVAFLCCRQQVQYGVGGTAHGDIQHHGVLESGLVRDVTRQHVDVILLVVALGQTDDALTGIDEQLFAIGVRGQQ